MSKAEIQTQDAYAVITGAASGIGRELARQAVDLGLNLALADVNEGSLKAVATELEARGAQVLARTVDISSADEVERFAGEVFEWAAGPVTLVFANAGIHGYSDAFDPDLAVWDRALAVNVMGVVHTARSFVQRLIDQDMPAQFVITASQGSFTAAPGMAPYIAAKHAVWGFADCLRLDVDQLDTPVGVSVVAPSRTDSGLLTERVEQLRSEGGEEAVDAYRAQMAKPVKIAEVVLREVRGRGFWIVPSHDPIELAVQPRIDELLAAMPAGRFENA